MADIRWAEQRDARMLAEIGVCAWQSALSGWGEGLATNGPAVRRRYMDFCMAYWDRILIAQRQHVAVGWAARQSLDEEVTDLWVAPQFQGRGVGKLLLTAQEGEIVRAGHGCVQLQTHADNQRAIRFFKRSGYRPVSLSVKYSSVLQQDLPIVVLRKDAVDGLYPAGSDPGR